MPSEGTQVKNIIAPIVPTLVGGNAIIPESNTDLGAYSKVPLALQFMYQASVTPPSGGDAVIINDDNVPEGTRLYVTSIVVTNKGLSAWGTGTLAFTDNSLTTVLASIAGANLAADAKIVFPFNGSISGLVDNGVAESNALLLDGSGLYLTNTGSTPGSALNVIVEGYISA